MNKVTMRGTMTENKVTNFIVGDVQMHNIGRVNLIGGRHGSGKSFLINSIANFVRGELSDQSVAHINLSRDFPPPSHDYDKELTLSAVQLASDRITGIEIEDFALPMRILYGDVSFEIDKTGSGVRAMANLAAGLSCFSGKVVFIEGLGEELHQIVHQPMMSLVRYATRKYDVQLFATVYKQNMIWGAHEAWEDDTDDDYDLRYHRIDPPRDTLTASGESWLRECITYNEFGMRASYDSKWGNI